MLDKASINAILLSSKSLSGGPQWRAASLPAVAASARQVLQRIGAIPHGARELEGGEQEELQAVLLLCFRVLRNACAAGPAACAEVLAGAGAGPGAGLLDLVASTLQLNSDAAITLNWQLPTAVAQALANLCTACAASAAAAWTALFPLQLGIMAHVNAGGGIGIGGGGAECTVRCMMSGAGGAPFCAAPFHPHHSSPPPNTPLQAPRRRPPAWRCCPAARRCPGHPWPCRAQRAASW